MWFGSEDQWTSWWISRPEGVHSRNIALRPEIAFVVFDSSAAPSAAQAVYARATAAQVDDPEGAEVLSRASVAAGLRAWTLDDLTGEDVPQLYRAVATEITVLDSLAGTGRDERFTVDL